MEYQVVLNAGGEGTRMHPYTLDKPKALVDVNGKTLIELAMQPFLKLGIEEFAITSSHKADMIKEFFKKRNIKVKFIDEPVLAGRAGAIRLGIEQGVLDPNKPTFVAHADDIIDIDLNRLIDAHKKSGCKVTLTLSKSFQNPYGVAKIENNKILGFIEKAWTKLPEGGIHTGLDLFSDLQDFVDIKIPSHPEQEIFPKLAKQGQLNAFFVEKWLPINTKQELESLKKGLNQH